MLSTYGWRARAVSRPVLGVVQGVHTGKGKGVSEHRAAENQAGPEGKAARGRDGGAGRAVRCWDYKRQVPSGSRAAPSATPRRGPRLTTIGARTWGPSERTRSRVQSGGGARTRQRRRSGSAAGGAGGTGGAARRGAQVRRGWAGRGRVQASPTDAAGSGGRGSGAGWAQTRARAGPSVGEHRREADGTADPVPGLTSDSAA